MNLLSETFRADQATVIFTYGTTAYKIEKTLLRDKRPFITITQYVSSLSYLEYNPIIKCELIVDFINESLIVIGDYLFEAPVSIEIPISDITIHSINNKAV